MFAVRNDPFIARFLFRFSVFWSDWLISFFTPSHFPNVYRIREYDADTIGVPKLTSIRLIPQIIQSIGYFGTTKPLLGIPVKDQFNDWSLIRIRDQITPFLVLFDFVTVRRSSTYVIAIFD